MIRRQPIQSRKSGSSLVLALVVVMTMVAVSASFFQVSSSITRRQVQAIDQKKAFYLAEAGIAEAFAAIQIGKTGVIGSPLEPALFGDGLFWVTTTDHDNGLHTIEATGMVGGARTVLSIVVGEGENSVAALGLFSTGDLEIPAGSLIDSYDSSLGDYVPPPPPTLDGPILGITSGGSGTSGGLTLESYEVVQKGSLTLYSDIGLDTGARVSSNGDITVKETSLRQTEVYGDVRHGPNESLSTTGDPLITGSTSPLATSVALPGVAVPPGVQEPGIFHSSATPLVLPPGNHDLAFIDVDADAQVTIEGPATVVVEDLHVETRGELVFDTSGGPINVIVTDDLGFDWNSFVSQTSTDPTRLVIQVAGDTRADFRGRGEIYGLIYAPEAETVVGRHTEIFGSVVASSLDLLGPNKIHFDLALAEKSLIEGVPQYEAWRIVEMVANENPSGDPFLALGVDPATLSQPADAHQDQNLKIEYYDRTGTLRTYDGLESNFDWSQVDQVVDLERDSAVVGGVKGLPGIGGIGGGSGIMKVTK